MQRLGVFTYDGQESVDMKIVLTASVSMATRCLALRSMSAGFSRAAGLIYNNRLNITYYSRLSSR